MKKLTLFLILLALAGLTAACGDGHSHNHNHNDNHSHDNHSHDNHSHGEQAHGARIPNNGAGVRIVSPASGATFSQNEQIIVEIAVENFTLGADGAHWHVYANEISYGMIMGANNEHVVRGLEPGSYLLSVYLADGDHRELEEGDSVQITVTAD